MPYEGSGNLLFVPAVTVPVYSPGWITEGMALTGWFTDSCPSTILPLSAKLGEHDVVRWRSASCSLLISALESRPRTVIVLTLSRVPIDVEQALFSVTDVSFAVPNPHFRSISKCQVSVCTTLQYKGLLRRHLRDKDRNPFFPAQRTSYDILLRDLGSIPTLCMVYSSDMWYINVYLY